MRKFILDDLELAPFLHSQGQKAKYSLRADIFRFTPKTGHGWKPLSCPFRATFGLMHRSKCLFDHLGDIPPKARSVEVDDIQMLRSRHGKHRLVAPWERRWATDSFGLTRGFGWYPAAPCVKVPKLGCANGRPGS
jgi:hypothetical protein